MLTAEEYISKNFDIIPCEKNSKQPKGSNWQNQITKIENFSNDDNIGLHLINYIDIDIDNPVCKHFLEQIKSKSNLIYGRDLIQRHISYLREILITKNGLFIRSLKTILKNLKKNLLS